jgi:hypothetical protein
MAHLLSRWHPSHPKTRGSLVSQQIMPAAQICTEATHGDTIHGVFTEKQLASFWRKVNKNGPIPPERPHLTPCWIWTGTKLSEGYGLWRQIMAHRQSYLIAGGSIPDKFTIDHLCRVRICVNPDHLEAVTRGENVRRGNSLPIVTSRTKRCQRGHDLSDERNVRNSTQGRRRCLICRRLTQQLKQRTDPEFRARQLNHCHAYRKRKSLSN